MISLFGGGGGACLKSYTIIGSYGLNMQSRVVDRTFFILNSEGAASLVCMRKCCHPVFYLSMLPVLKEKES